MRGLARLRGVGGGLYSPMASISSALAAVATLVIATRAGGFADVAGFTAGSAVIALFAVGISGGTTLSFAVATKGERRSIQVVRRRVILPGLLLGSVLASFTVTSESSVPKISVLLGGLVVAATNFNELDAVRFQRAGDLRKYFIIVAATRLLSVPAVIVTGHFSWSMAAAAIATSACIALGSPKEEDDPSAIRFMASIRHSYSPGATVMSLLDHGGSRWPMMAAPWLFATPVAGMLNSVLQIWLTAGGVLISLPFTALATRGAAREGQARQYERLGALLAALACLVLLFSSDILAGILSIPDANAGAWIRILAVAVLFRVFARLAQYRLVSRRRFGLTAMTYVPLAFAWLPIVVFAREQWSPTSICYTVLVGEMLVFLLAWSAAIWNTGSVRDGR